MENAVNLENAQVAVADEKNSIGKLGLFSAPRKKQSLA